MHYDFTNTSRDAWKYAYSGADLLPYAKRKLDVVTADELRAREILAAFLKDPNINLEHDPQVKTVRIDIERNSKLKEECSVFVHEFTRKPERDFQLSLGDVTFFGLLDRL